MKRSEANSRRFSRAKRERMRAAKSETRREKSRKAFFVLKQKQSKKAKLRQKFFFFLRKSPYFWGKKLLLLKKSIFIYRKSIKIYRKSINPQSIFAKPNTPFLHLLCLYNLLGFLGCSLLLGVPPRPDAARRCVPLTGELLLPPVAP